MKNKKFTYLLIGLVALIWGFFFYILFSDSSTSTEIQTNNFEISEIKDDSIFFKELDLSYDDPFFKRKIISKGYKQIQPSVNQNIVPPKAKKTAVKKTVNKFVWPKVEYGGTLNNVKGLVTLKNQLLIVTEGQDFEEFKIINLYPDSIRISYREKTKVFLKNR